MGQKKSKSERKSRSEWTHATTSGEVSEIGFSYDPVTDTVSFTTPVENTYHEVSYERTKRPKVLNRTPLSGADLKLQANPALKDFDLLVALDTNTRLISGCSLSVTGIVLGSWVSDPRTGSKSLYYRTPFCLEFVELCEPREKIGWIMALTELSARGHITEGTATAVVVDAHLADIPTINARKEPVFADVYLPVGVTLLYASADVGAEYGSNKLIRYADQVSTRVLEYMVAGRVEPNKKVLSGRPFKAFRIVRGKDAVSG